MSKLLIVIPAYNEEANIVKVVNGIVKNYPQYDYVVVNDGSRDKTAAICREHGFRLIDLPVNLGLAGAFQTGLRYAAENGYDCAMQLDADGQHRPEYIAAMLEELESGADIVIGSRFLTVKKPKSLRMLGSYIISWSIRLTTGRAICDPTSGMRLFNRAMVEEFAQNLNYGPEPDTISYLIKNGAVVREVQVTMGEREAGQSYLTFWRSIEYMVKMSISILLIQWFRKRDTETPYPERSLYAMFDQPIIRVCLVLGSLITATYILRRVRLAKVQIEDTIFWLLFSGILLILAIFPGIAYWAAYLLGFQSPINFVYIVIIFLLLAKQFFMSIRLSQLDSKVRILTQRVALNEEKIESEKLDL